VDSLLGEGVDAASICTPPTSHRRITEAAVAAGVDELLDKPVAHSLEDTHTLVLHTAC
jgi:predicted dehydrogenase